MKKKVNEVTDKTQLTDDSIEAKLERLTIMLSASEKEAFIEYCFKRGVARSEMGRLILKEWMESRERWRSMEERQKIQIKCASDNTEESNYYFSKMRHYRNQNKKLLKLLEANRVKVPWGTLTRFTGKKPECWSSPEIESLANLR